MNRRDFFKVAGATTAAVAFPKVLKSEPPKVDPKLVQSTRGTFTAHYIIGPGEFSCWEEIQDLYPCSPAETRNNVKHKRSLYVEVKPGHHKNIVIRQWVCNPEHHIHIRDSAGKTLAHIGDGIQVYDDRVLVQYCSVFECARDSFCEKGCIEGCLICWSKAESGFWPGLESVNLAYVGAYGYISNCVAR